MLQYDSDKVKRRNVIKNKRKNGISLSYTICFILNIHKIQIIQIIWMIKFEQELIPNFFYVNGYYCMKGKF